MCNAGSFRYLSSGPFQAFDDGLNIQNFEQLYLIMGDKSQPLEYEAYASSTVFNLKNARVECIGHVRQEVLLGMADGSVTILEL